MIRACCPDERSRIHHVINDAAIAYRGIIPDDRWHEPYMGEDELEAEIAAGVRFSAGTPPEMSFSASWVYRTCRT